MVRELAATVREVTEQVRREGERQKAPVRGRRGPSRSQSRDYDSGPDFFCLVGEICQQHEEGNTSPCHHSLHLFAKTYESQQDGMAQKPSDQDFIHVLGLDWAAGTALNISRNSISRTIDLFQMIL